MKLVNFETFRVFYTGQNLVVLSAETEFIIGQK